MTIVPSGSESAEIYVVKLRTKIGDTYVENEEMSNREIVFGTKERCIHVKDKFGTLQTFIPKDDNSLNQLRTWSSFKIKQYVDSVAAAGPDMANYYTKTEVNNLLILKSNIEHVHNSNIILNNSTLPGTDLNDVLEYIDGVITSYGTSDTITNSSSLPGTTLNDVLEYLHTGGSSNSSKVVIELENNTGTTIVKGTPVYISSSNKIGLAQGIITDSKYTCIGLTDSSITNGNTGFIATMGLVEMTTISWANVLVGTESLIPNTVYYLSHTEPGKISYNYTESDDNVIAPVGVAISGTKFLVQISRPVIL